MPQGLETGVSESFEWAREHPVRAARSASTEPGGALALLASRRFGPLFAAQFLWRPAHARILSQAKQIAARTIPQHLLSQRQASSGTNSFGLYLVNVDLNHDWILGQ